MQIVDATELSNVEMIYTQFGQCPGGSFRSYQLGFTESNFTVWFDFNGFATHHVPVGTVFPLYPSFPLDNYCSLLILPETLSDEEKELLDGLKVNVVEANKLEECTT